MFRKMKLERPEIKIALFGLYGWGSLGDNALQQAILEELRQRFPSAQFYGICPNPRVAEAELGIPAFPIGKMPGDSWIGQKSRLFRWPLFAVIRIPFEILLWVRAFLFLHGFNFLIFSGGGQLSDYDRGPLRKPYDLFRWTTIAKIRKVRTLFLSIGAGPIDSIISSWFIKSALTAADYRSYRDDWSKEYIADRVTNFFDDPIYPDLAFSLKPKTTRSPRAIENRSPVVGIGVMAYYDPRGWPKQDESVYKEYILKLVGFVSWLVRKKYILNFIIGDYLNDSRSVVDICGILQRNNVPFEEDQITNNLIQSNEDLYNEISRADIVVATRFHNVIFSLIQNKPVLAISYNRKTDDLMKNVGLSEYCLSIDNFNMHMLRNSFNKLELNSKKIKSGTPRHIQKFRAELTEQYELLFN